MSRLTVWLHHHSKRHSRRGLYDFLTESVREHCSRNDAAVLNVGAGGEVARHIQRLDLQVTSVDIDPRRGPDLVMDVTDLRGFGDDAFDAVVFMEGLEHVTSPGKAAAEIERVLKPGGVLIGSTPFILGVHDRPHDYFRYTAYGLQLLFRDFEQVNLKSRNGYVQAVQTLLLRLFARGSQVDSAPMVLVAPLILSLSPVFWLLNKLIRCDDATTGYVFVFRKRRR